MQICLISGHLSSAKAFNQIQSVKDVCKSRGFDLINQIEAKRLAVDFSEITGLIVFGKSLTEAATLMVMALSRGVAVLALYEPGQSLPANLSQIRSDSKMNFMSQELNEEYLVTLESFLEKLEQGVVSEQVKSPTIKFTLRLTPKIEQFLNQRSKQLNKSKADLAREIIEEKMNQVNSQES